MPFAANDADSIQQFGRVGHNDEKYAQYVWMVSGRLSLLRKW